MKEKSGEKVIRCRSEPVLNGKVVEERHQSSQIVVSEIKVNTVVTDHNQPSNQIRVVFLI